MLLTKLKNGNYAPVYRRDIEESAKIAVGDEVSASRARNPKFHRKVMAVVNMMFENQDKFQNKTLFRKWLTLKAGFIDGWIDGTDGHPYPMPKSWSFEEMSQAEFEKLYQAIKEIASKELKISLEDVEKNSEDYY